MNEALALNSTDPNSLQLDGDLLMKLGRTEDAIAVYKQILAVDANNRFALTSMGYASRAVGRDQDAEKYFQRLAQAYPTLMFPGSRWATCIPRSVTTPRRRAPTRRRSPWLRAMPSWSPGA